MQVQGQNAAAPKKYKNFVHGMFKIVSEEGVSRGIMKGITPSLLREASYSTCRLGLYEPIKLFLGETDPKTTPTWKRFTSGAMAGLLGSGFANPLDLIKTRMQASPKGEVHSMRWHISDIYHNQGGLLGFYQGMIPCMARAAFVNAAYMGTYDTTKHFLINHQFFDEGVKCQFISTVVAGLNMTIFSSPADNVKTRIMNMRKSASGNTKTYNGVIDCVVTMWKHEGGISAFYRGFGGQWARFAPLITT